MNAHDLPTPPLDHAVYGNGRLLALVSPTSAIEWLCLPRFDSPSVFARLLDREKGGTFRVLHTSGELAGELAYLPNTNVVRSVFSASDGSWEVIDFAPRIPAGLGVTVPIEIMRIVRPLEGQPQLIVDFDPRPDYGRVQPQIRELTLGLEISGTAVPLQLMTNLPTPYITARRPFVLAHPLYFVLSYGPRRSPPTYASVLHDFERTVSGWRAWARSCALPSFASETVLRSALCLKLHAYHDTGAIIAATTTSIPEAMGTPRTWDYRFCWLRDSAFTVEALRRLSQVAEGEHLIRFLRDVAEAGPLQPVYSVDGGRELTECFLPHLAGFGGNGHVRIGNAAFHQKQHDLMGEIILCLETQLSDPRIVHDEPSAYFPLIRRLVEQAIELADKPDTSIWEFRSYLRNYTFSRAMCWVAVRRGSSLARRFGQTALADQWLAIADREQQLILERGFDPGVGYFTQALDGRFPDASNLLLPTLGLVDGRDPRFVSTVEAYQKNLVEGGLMLRYRNEDDFGETTSAFTICSFWWAEALALMGRLEEAIAVFHRVASYANPVGLFSEDVDPATGTLLGNFPQAYTHVGLIHAAMTIGELLDARDGRVRAWA
ncbi:MAG TPA: glycoside hydrolase family 15 protein [Gemmatimonadales bacterium]|nr:glycoside hydrolase family 15 protein [Gemmatimonadales bacterium]